jgi:uncharacterized damage-inducible protein DinB
MTEREFFIFTVADEAPRFERALAAIPTENADYRPDPKSKTAMELAANMVGEAGPVIKKFIAEGQVDFAKVDWPQITTPADAAAQISTMFAEVKALAESTSDEVWDSEAAAGMNGNFDWKSTRGKMAWSMLLDLIHHRGQLSTYLRPMGGKVPSIYGPSADMA